MSVERRRGHGGDPSGMVREVWCERGAHARVHAWSARLDQPYRAVQRRHGRDSRLVRRGARLGIPARLREPRRDYHLFAYSAQGGGGIRQPHPARQQAARPPCTWTTPTRRTRPRWRPERGRSRSRTRQSCVRIALVRAPGGVLDRAVRADRLTGRRPDDPELTTSSPLRARLARRLRSRSKRAPGTAWAARPSRAPLGEGSRQMIEGGSSWVRGLHHAHRG